MDQLQLDIVEHTTASWEFWHGLLEQFVADNGHARVPRAYRTADGYALGAWVGTQRTRRGNLIPEQIAKLEELDGWVWKVS